jgi:L-asparaginase
MEKPTVHVIGTGGTIAGKLGPFGEIIPGLSAKELVDRVPLVDDYAYVTAEDFLQVSSGDIGFREMLSLGHRIEEVLGGPDVSGVVVTHGTTTLEQTAYLIDTILHVDSPIVVTGAMRNPSLIGNDGSVNLLNAIQVAACPRSRGLGVLVVMNGFIHTARDVTKRHSTNVSAFQSPEFGPVGAIDEDYVYYARRPFTRLPRIAPKAITARVRLIPFSLSDDDVLAQAAVARDLEGLVLEGIILNSRQVELVTEAIARGKFVVMANPFSLGRLPRATYRREGSEAHLLSLGVAFAGTSALKAKVKLILALSAGLSQIEIREMFHSEWQ